MTVRQMGEGGRSEGDKQTKRNTDRQTHTQTERERETKSENKGAVGRILFNGAESVPRLSVRRHSAQKHSA